MNQKTINPTSPVDQGGGHVVDELGGVHDGGVGWNPNGVFCGECGEISCVKCQYRNRKHNDE